jgi:hypothetical protein
MLTRWRGSKCKQGQVGLVALPYLHEKPWRGAIGLKGCRDKYQPGKDYLSFSHLEVGQCYLGIASSIFCPS